MAPTLKSNLSPFRADWVLIEKISLRWQEPERGDLIFFQTYDELTNANIQVIKRVAGLPGEEIEIKRGALFVNGKKTNEISEDIQKRYVNGGVFGARQKLKILPDNYMVLGDNSEVSLDSRYYGALTKSNLQGIGILRVWPLWRLGIL
jgi:signal peptidase I